MKQTLKHQPDSYSYRDLLVSFANGKPLSCDQLNFIYQHEKALSAHHFDPMLKYYLRPLQHHHDENNSFLLPFEKTQCGCY